LWNVSVIASVFVLLFAVQSLWAQQDAGKTLPVSRLIDRGVFNDQGEEISEVDDVVIRRNGRIKRVTIEVGGFLDIGDKLIALPLKMVQIQEKGQIVVGMSQAQLEKKEEFDYFKHGLEPYYYYYPTRPYRRPYSPYYHYNRPPAYDYGPPDARYPSPQPYNWAYYPRRFLASTVLDRRIINQDGKEIGEVKDLILDIANNKVFKIVIDVNKDTFGKEGYVAAPYKQMGFSSYNLIYDMSIKELRNLPEYDYKE
jgi:sporulation protein YlmC with PRC-barrel domain